MERLKPLGFALIALLSTMLTAASIAQGVELKLLPPKAKFNYNSIGGATLETLTGKKVECEHVEGKGEVLSERLGEVTLVFEGCKSLGIACTGLSDTTSGHITIEAEFHIRHLLEGEGVSIAFLVGHVHFSCSIVLLLVLGCVASMDLLSGEKGENVVNHLRMSYFVSFLQTKGDQEPTSIDTDNSLAMETCTLKVKEGTGEYVSSGLLGSGEVKDCENEIGQLCTFLIDLSGTP
jgi:hypothetical protein